MCIRDRVLTPEQLALVAAAASYLRSHQQYELWRRFRPVGGARPTDSASARQWWHSLGMALRHEIVRRQPRFDWAMLQARRAERKRYVQLYTAKLRTSRHRSRLSDAESKELSEVAALREEVSLLRHIIEDACPDKLRELDRARLERRLGTH